MGVGAICKTREKQNSLTDSRGIRTDGRFLTTSHSNQANQGTRQTDGRNAESAEFAETGRRLNGREQSQRKTTTGHERAKEVTTDRTDDTDTARRTESDEDEFLTTNLTNRTNQGRDERKETADPPQADFAGLNAEKRG